MWNGITKNTVIAGFSLSFADIKSRTYDQARKEIMGLLTNLYNKYYFLLETDILTKSQKEYFQLVNFHMEDAVAVKAIQNLCLFLHQYYRKKVIILLDEYDTPMQEAYVKGYWEEMVSFIRSLFNATFKTNPYLERGLMTGITRVSKESIFSDLNHLKVVTTTSEKYATCFGFTEKEVFRGLDEYGLSEEKEEVKRWYDGFIFGKTPDIYNPWSILNFLDTGEYEPYWANTSSNELINTLIREGNRKVKESGFGRYDIMMKLKREELPAIIIEFKVFHKRRKKDLEETVVSALAQIEEKQYGKELMARGIAKERIRKYGFAFEGKKVLIGDDSGLHG